MMMTMMTIIMMILRSHSLLKEVIERRVSYIKGKKIKLFTGNYKHSIISCIMGPVKCDLLKKLECK